MGEKTGISWTHHTWSPWWGCTKVDPCCERCYAEAFDKRVGGAHWGPGRPRRELSGAHWREPIRWNREARDAGERRRVFPSMCDPFDLEAPARARFGMWELIHETPYLDWLLLTKRPQNIPTMLPALWGDGWRNVWLGVSIGHPGALPFLDALRAVPAAVRWISAEPLIAPWVTSLKGIDLVVVGGESGPRPRPMDVAWARALLGQARLDGVAVWMKQLGGHPDRRERLEDFPPDLRVREMPEVSRG